MSFLK